MGGKPNPGTSPDKRLSQNKPGKKNVSTNVNQPRQLPPASQVKGKNQLPPTMKRAKR